MDSCVGLFFVDGEEEEGCPDWQGYMYMGDGLDSVYRGGSDLSFVLVCGMDGWFSFGSSVILSGDPYLDYGYLI